MKKLVEKTNIVGGGVIAILSAAFGQVWIEILFPLYKLPIFFKE